MAFITKSQASKLTAAYLARLPDIIGQQLESAFAAGSTSLTVSYLPASVGQANAFRTLLENAGWTVIQDNTAFTLTIS